MGGGISKLGWYWHRLRAMSPQEVRLRLQKKRYQKEDRRRAPDFTGMALEGNGTFPKLPQKEDAPTELLEALRHDAQEILEGRWRAFGHLPLQVDDPPKWQCDYLAGRDLQSDRAAFELNHRALPDGADIKVIWELGRWNELVRLAMAAWLLEDDRAQAKCIEWLHHWCRTNRPFTGLNWTSGLETGIRLIQFTWMDALLCAARAPAKQLAELRQQILPAHVWYTWRYRSFGSSANNHLIGELAGLAMAVSRWPELAKMSAPSEEIGGELGREVMEQFASDGGNREQALGYHLFSWEFCWQAVRALEAGGVPVAAEVKKRLVDAGSFYRAVRPENGGWDYGDGDNAWVTPLFAKEENAAREWWRWFDHSASSPAIRYWWGDFPATSRPPTRRAWQRWDSYVVFQSEDWFVRLDHSALGYLSMAPHGHLDALHVSVWFRGEAVIIDPGTGGYYADKTVRDYLAGWSAHNGPHLRTPREESPKRYGTFLWGAHHPQPRVRVVSPVEVSAELELPYGMAKRTVAFDSAINSLRITDAFTHTDRSAPVVTRWKFAPGYLVANPVPGTFQIGTGKSVVRLQISAEWKAASTYNPPAELRGKTAATLADLGSVPMGSIVSPAFRKLSSAAFLTLEGSGEGQFELIVSPG